METLVGALFRFCVLTVGLIFAFTIIGFIFEGHNAEVDKAIGKSYGVIMDFEVSAGGFGHSDLCPTTFTNGEKIVLSGSVCKDLEVGKTVVAKESSASMLLFGTIKSIDYEVK